MQLKERIRQKAWERCTGEEWEYYKKWDKDKKKDLNWDEIKKILANNAKYKDGWNYYQNIVYVGDLYWEVNNENINISGNYPTYLISSRSWDGSLGFRYYYTIGYDDKSKTWKWEIWCLYDDRKYIFYRENGKRESNPIYGITLDKPAVTLPGEYEAEQIISKALNWLKNQQKEDHTWIYDENNLFKPAMTALASLCFLNYGYDP
jgi:arsenate reductase-like glutaredoxin family protein